MRTLLTGGAVISLDPLVGDLDRGDVLIEDGVIVELAERIDAPDAEAIDATDRIVLPGFVDTHSTLGRRRFGALVRTGPSPTTWWPCTTR
jgi:cytosine/adenosine deaminase-related metal-dependent hydrolase